jgi:serine/threonine protein kinase
MVSFTPVRLLGNGAFGFVFEAWDNNSNRKVALKRTQKCGNKTGREHEILE